MAVAHDASTRWPATENTADTTTGDRTVTHTPSGTPRGVVVVICVGNVASAPVTGVLYGGVAMTLATFATDTTENGRVDVWVLTSGVPSGAQTVTFQGCSASAKFATVSTVTAATTETAAYVVGAVNTTTAADPQVALTIDVTSQIYGGLHTGNTSPSGSPLSGCTLQNNRDYGSLAAQTLRRTSADSAGTVTLGVTLVSEDYCIAAVALSEPAPFPLFGSIGTQQQGDVSTMSVDVPDNVATDDIIVVAAFVGDATTVTAMPSGFSNAPDSPVVFGTSPFDDRLYVMWKRATGADSTAGTYDFTLSGTVYTNSAAARYTGAVTSGDPWDVTAAASDGTNGTTSPAVSDTTTADNTLLVWASTNWAGGAWTPPTGFTERRDSGDQVCTIADKPQTAAGATGSITGTCAGSGKRAAWVGALKAVGNGDATVSASTVAATAAVGSPTLRADQTAAPGVVAATASVPTPTVTTGTDATATPSTVAATATVPSVTVAAGAGATPATVAATATVGSPTIQAGAVPAPSTVAATTTVGSPTVQTGSTVTASTVAATASVPTPTLQAGAVVTATTVAATASVPAPSVSVGGSATVAPSTVSATATVPAPTIQAGAVVTLTTVAGVAAIATPAVAAGTVAVPATVTAAVSISAPTVTTGEVEPGRLTPSLSGPTLTPALSGSLTATISGPTLTPS